MAKEEKSGGIMETVKTVVYALLIAGVFRTLFFQPFWIPSGSMKDTLLIGDFLFVNKMSYGYSYASCPSIRLPQIGIDNAESLTAAFWLSTLCGLSILFRWVIMRMHMHAHMHAHT